MYRCLSTHRFGGLAASLVSLFLVLPRLVGGGSSPSYGETLQGWLNEPDAWGVTVQENNSTYYEDDTLPVRLTALLPAGSKHTLQLSFDFSASGARRFIDFLESVDATVPDAALTAGYAGLPAPVTWTIPADPTLPKGLQQPGRLTTYNISALTFGCYLDWCGVKRLSLSFTVAAGTGSKRVILGYGAHLADQRFWGIGNGAAFFPGASRKAYASLDGRSEKNVSVNPGTIAIVDAQPPVIQCPADMVVPTDAGQCGAVVTYAPVATDTGSGVASLVCAPPSGSAFPIGETTVVCTATDWEGNTSHCEFKVTVLDPGNVAWPLAMPLALADGGAPGLATASMDQCINTLDQSRWYKLKVTPGSRLFVTLTGLTANYDLVVFKDIAAAYNELTSLDSLTRLNAEFASDAFSPASFSADALSPASFAPASFAPASFAPASFSADVFSPASFAPASFAPASFAPDAYAPASFAPASFAPASFAPASFSPASFAPASFAPASFASAQIRSVIGVSAFEGTAGEGIVVNTWDNQGDFYVRVRGRNGAFDPGSAFHLEVYLVAGECEGIQTAPPDGAGGTAAPSVFRAPAGAFKTLIVADPARLPGTAEEKANLQAKLAALAAHPAVQGAVINPADDSWVAFFNGQADAKPECPFAKNLVAGAIQAVIDRSQDGNALEYIVLIGNDGAIPFFRYPDQALLGPEKNYVPPVREFSASQASLRLNYVLSQDRYGAGCSVSSKVSSLPVPGLAVGRLVETPAEIIGMIDAFLGTGPGGVAPLPNAALVTGYDFLADAADAVAAELTAGLGKPVDSLITARSVPPTSPLSWTADQLRSLLLSRRYDLIYLAGHFSAASALAADYVTQLPASELAASSLDLRNVLLFSAGCHSGYNIVDPDSVPNITGSPDWAQAAARKQMTLVAGTGYQYGDTDFIEYSEKLYLEFSRQLRTGSGPVPIGKALVRAKQAYLQTTPDLRELHEKAFLQTTLFGLPMLAVNLPGARLVEDSATSIITATTGFPANPGLTLGLRYADLQVVPTFTPHQVTLKDEGNGTSVEATYDSGSGGVLNSPGEPILPLEVRSVGLPGTVLRGVGFRGSDYTDTPGVLPLTGAATTEIRGVHGAFQSPVLYPVQPWSVNYFGDLCGQGDGQTRLLAVSAQFGSGNTDPLRGTLRRHSRMDFRLYYSANFATYTDGSGVPSLPGLSAPPAISGVSAAVVGNDVHFSTRVTGNPAAGIQEVWVTFTASSGPYSGKWQPLDLVQNLSDSTLWEAVLPLNGTSPEQMFYLVQAVNGVGLVSLEASLGGFYRIGLTGSTADTALELVNPPATAPYGTPVSIQARLTTGGAPLPGQLVRFTLGDQGITALTDGQGLAQFNFTVAGLPGPSDAQAVFSGSPGYGSSSAAASFAISRQPTALVFEPVAFATQPGVPPDASVLLTDSLGKPILERTVVFVVDGPTGSATQTAITDFNGRARLGGFQLPDGEYTVTAYFGGIVPLSPPNAPIVLEDDRYAAATATGTLAIDGTPPVLTCPADLVLSTSAGLCSATGVYDVVVSDNRPGATLVCTPPSGSVFEVGTTPVTCTATDAVGNTSACTFNVVVKDVNPPEIQCPADIVVSTAPDGRTAVVNYSPTAMDACGAVTVTCSPPSGFTFGLGTTPVTCKAVDNAGNVATCTFNVTVKDTDPPVVKCLIASPVILWPPNHRLVNVCVGVSASDNAGPTSSRILSIVSSEPANGTGDGDQAPDFEITGALTAKLRAERAQSGPGRTYTLNVETRDGSGNAIVNTTKVYVPK